MSRMVMAFLATVVVLLVPRMEPPHLDVHCLVMAGGASCSTEGR
jgi:hypothetical protein